MAATGLAFPNVDRFAVIAIVAFIGTINPSTGDLGVLVPLEHAMLAHGVPDHERTRTFARYSLIGALSMAAGSLGRGVARSDGAGRHRNTHRLQDMFYAYAALGLISAALYRRLPHAQMRGKRGRAHRSGRRAASSTELAALFSLDAFAGGFVVQSLLALWLFERFDLSLSTASVFFFWATTLARILLSGGGLARQAHRPRQHDGVHAHSVEPLPDPGGVLAEF